MPDDIFDAFDKIRTELARIDVHGPVEITIGRDAWIRLSRQAKCHPEQWKCCQFYDNHFHWCDMVFRNAG